MFKSRLSIGLLGILVLFSQCKKALPSLPDPGLVSRVFSSYTRGIIASGSMFKYVFNEDIVADEVIGKGVEKSVFKIRPSVSGNTYWESKNTLVFKPSEKLKPGSMYTINLDIQAISPSLAKNLPSLDYAVQTKELSFTVNRPKIDLGENETYIVTGDIELSDELDNATIEKLVSAKLGTTNLSIQWLHNPQGLWSSYTISKIPKSSKDAVTVSWDGAVINVKKAGNHEIRLPEPGVFSVMDVLFENDPEKRIVSSFSENVKMNQDINGLVSFRQTNFNEGVRHVIEGNKIYSYISNNLSGDVSFELYPGIQSITNKKLIEKTIWDLSISGTDPQVRFIGKGNIIPQTNETMIPFEAVGLTAVDVEVFKIFDHNILQFLQVNELGENNELYRVGRIVHQQKVELNTAKNTSNKWAHYALDLAPMIKAEPNAIYQIRIGFRPEYTTLECANQLNSNSPNEGENLLSFYDDNYYGYAGYYNEYDYDDRNNPCKPAYYNFEHFIARNVLVSNFGIIGKVSDKNIFIAVTDLRTTDPIAGATVDIFNFQSEKIAQVTTDADGIAQQTLAQVPNAVIVTQNGNKGYLRLAEGNNLNTSAFDVDGQEVQKGLKGFIYTERGVWRPGDSIYLSFILNDINAKLPSGHPVQLKVYDPQGKIVVQKIVSKPIGYIYSFPFKTSPDALTGTWRAVISAGGTSFSKPLMIEAVKPNRLKIQFDATDEIFPNQSNIPLHSSWLSGLQAGSLTSKVTSTWKADEQGWSIHKSFIFHDPARQGNEPPETTLFEGDLNENGEASVPIKISKDFKPSGKMKVRFNIEVSEPGGDFSTYSNSSTYHPYKNYVGVHLPDDQWGYKTLYIDRPSTIQFVSIDAKGNTQPNRKLSVGLYELDWRWWWEQRDNSYADYNTTDHKRSISKSFVTSNANGLAEWKVNINHWGRYMIRVCDTESGHCSGDFAYAGWPDNGDNNSGFDMATLIKIQTDKEKYKSSETIHLNIPAPVLSKMLITLENGSRVIESHWVNVDKTPFVFSFQATPQMAPAVYAHICLIQPHGFQGNEMPMRMYGILPIYVENGDSKLAPVITTSTIFRPEQNESIEIAESNGKPMTYTLDIIDEGLLDLTNFKTPDPYTQFNSKEALGVRTWDVYDYVMGAFGGNLESILSVGGDEGLINDKSNAANRFKSPVIHLGPFELKKGEKKKHQIQIKNYVGSVRVMAVAANENAYGNAEKTIPVKSPLMILPTLPRVLSVGEKIKMPVNIFITESGLNIVSLQVKDKSGLVQGSGAQNISIDKLGEQLVYFDLTAPSSPGKSTLLVEAKSGSHTAKNEIEIETRNPNPYTSTVTTVLLEPGASKTFTLDAKEKWSNQKALVEIATFEPIKMNKYLDDLLQYPYGCAEQTISAVFPQLYLENMITLSPKQSLDAKHHIEEAITKLSKFSLADGSFALWPGSGQSADLWVTSYIGHFMMEAQKNGFVIPDQLLSKWKSFQKRAANAYNPSQKIFYKPNHGLDQAYRLYSMAMAGIPDLGAMNRLKEYGDLGGNAKWRLATAYAIIGQVEVANSLINKVPDLSDYAESGYTYGSPIRDQAMILETYMSTNDKNKAAGAAIELTKLLNEGRPWNTQGLAYALQVLSKFKGNTADNSPWSFKYSLDNGAKESIVSKTASFLIDPQLNKKSAKSILIENSSSKPLYVQTTIKGQPVSDQLPEASNSLKIAVVYKNKYGEQIDPSILKKGDEIKTDIIITHPGNPAREYNNLALNHIVPAGWEIINDRMKGENNTNQNFVYQDIRDDRVYTFFKLYPGKSVTYSITLRATYAGEYTMPAIVCEDMYDAKINARSIAGRVVVE